MKDLLSSGGELTGEVFNEELVICVSEDDDEDSDDDAIEDVFVQIRSTGACIIKYTFLLFRLSSLRRSLFMI